MAFVLGSGPSLHNLDFSLIANHVTLAVNSAILKAPKSDYYFTCDFGMVVWKSWLTLKNLNCELILYNVDVGFRHLEYLIKGDVFEGINKDRITYFNFDDSNLIMKKYSCNLIRGSTSSQVAIHFAYLMGCSPIVLLGCDCKYVDGKHHYYDYPGEEVDEFADERYYKFKPKNFIVQEGESNKYLRGHVVCWEKIQNQNPEVPIIDASGGELTMFPQMSLEKVIERYGI